MDRVVSAVARKKFGRIASESAQLFLVLAFVLAAAAALVLVWMTTGKQGFAVAAALFLAIIGALVSGNSRLYSLWGLMLTLPLTLGKRFGPMFIGKPGGEDSFRIEINDLFLIVLVGFLLWDLLTECRTGLRIPKVTFLWMLLIGIGCAWIVAGPWRITAAHEVFRMLKVMILFLVITNELNRSGRIYHCITAFTLAAMAQSVIALIQYRMKGLIGLQILGETTSSTINVLKATSVQGEQVFRPSGLLQHANLLAVFLGVAIVIAIGMLMVDRRTVPRAFFLTAVALAMPAEVVAMSRSAWVSVTLALIFLLVSMFMHPRLRLRAAITSIAIGMVAVVVLTIFLGPITQRLLRSKDDATTAREIYKADARRMIASAPWLGLGLNSYVFELPNYATLSIKAYGDQPPAVHNIFYLWWAETGIVGLLLFCVVWASIIYAGFANFKVGDELLFVVNASCLAAIIGLIPDSFFSFTLRVNTTLRLFWFLAGVIMAVRYLRLQERRIPAVHRTAIDSRPTAMPLVEPPPSQ